MRTPLPAAVLFDLDDTLLAHREAVANGIRCYLSALGVGLEDPDAAAEQWHDLEELHYHRYLAGELDYQGQRRARAIDFAEAHGLALTAEEAGPWFDGYAEHYRASWRLHDDALECLAALRKTDARVRVGIITNGDELFQRRKLDAVGLSALVDLVVASGSVGAVKPDARIFRYACDALDLPVERAAYVGDRLRTDAIGAASAGLTGVWLNRRGVSAEATDRSEADAEGVIEITSLDDLLPALVASENHGL